MSNQAWSDVGEQLDAAIRSATETVELVKMARGTASDVGMTPGRLGRLDRFIEHARDVRDLLKAFRADA